eukprot:g1444.t1
MSKVIWNQCSRARLTTLHSFSPPIKTPVHCCTPSKSQFLHSIRDAFLLTPPLFLVASAGPVFAVELPSSLPQGSYYVTLGLFVMTVPGLWSLIKRSTKSKIKRRSYLVAGPAKEGAMDLSERAKQISRYFLNYNYRVKSTSDVIVFVGDFQSSLGQALQLVLYTFFGLGSIALVLSIQVPELGNYWYGLTLISPLAGWYYWTNAEREEEVKVKLATAEDDSETEIIIEGDEEELDRFSKELKLQEKGKVYVKGILE